MSEIGFKEKKTEIHVCLDITHSTLTYTGNVLFLLPVASPVRTRKQVTLAPSPGT